jgi:hypothetical protein
VLKALVDPNAAPMRALTRASKSELSARDVIAIPGRIELIDFYYQKLYFLEMVRPARAARFLNARGNVT